MDKLCSSAMSRGNLFLSVMSILGLLDITQPHLGCQIYCRLKSGFLLGEFVTVPVSHDCFIEMKPDVALFIATNLCMNITEFPVITVQTPVSHWITLNPRTAKGVPVNIIKRCRALFVTCWRRCLAVTMKIIGQCWHHKSYLSQVQTPHCTSSFLMQELFQVFHYLSCLHCIFFTTLWSFFEMGDHFLRAIFMVWVNNGFTR